MYVIKFGFPTVHIIWFISKRLLISDGPRKMFISQKIKSAVFEDAEYENKCIACSTVVLDPKVTTCLEYHSHFQR